MSTPTNSTIRGADGKPHEGADAPELLTILSKYLGQQPAQVEQGIAFVDPDGRLLVGDIRRQIAWYKAHGMVDAGVDAANILDLSFVEGHYDR